MKRHHTGFTLVELVIAIVVVAILAAIVILAWAGVGAWSRDQARESDVRNWVSTFDLYKSRYAVWPALPTGNTTAGDVTLCLGASFTNDKCGQFKSSSTSRFVDADNSSSMLANVKKVGEVPKNGGPANNNFLVGPLVYLKQTTSGSTVTVTAEFINFFEGNCPSGFKNINSSLPASIANVRSGLPAGTHANVCAIYPYKTFSYKPL